ncbi:CD209 antigen-like protein E isoform X3 [Sparus aurata]|uniref:CD209 antigen-like protein E isoform X3 n=1 Tax=Sparus aurata TaxID=8175 RepID=UPI0011C1183E|nr:CD209 antigen-like protein E isoform X3 [Sparus aurata]
MSAEILAAPDSSFNVRFIRRENRGEGEEMEVEILEDEEHHADLGSQQARPNTEQNGAAVKRRCFRAPAVTLGVMYLLMLAGIYIRFTLEKDQLQNKYDKLSNNYTQLQETASVNNNQLKSSYETLSKNHSKLQDEVKKLKDEIQVNNSQLQEELQKLKDKIEDNNRQFEAKVKQLKDKIKGMTCPDGWTRFGCSCYFRSNQMKTWQQSRTDCQNKGADLVVINNKDENNFVSDLTKLNGESWIGLKTEWSTGRSSYEWKWVDGSPLKETFGASRLQAASWEQYAAYCNRHRQWTDINYGSYKYWICEKEISCTL